MTPTDRPIFARALYALGETFNEPVSEIRAEAYFDALGDLPIADVLTACRQAMRDARFFPRPVELRERLEGTIEDRADVAWTAVRQLVRAIGYYGRPRDTDWPDAAAERAALDLFGGWQRLCASLPADGPELLGYAKQFKASYRAQDGRRRQDALEASAVAGYLCEP